MFELQSYPRGCPMQYKLGLKLCITFDTCLSGPTLKMSMFKLAWSTQSAISQLLSAVRGQRSSPVAIARDFWTSSYLFFTLLLRKGARAKLQISMGALTEWCVIELGRVHVFALMFCIKGTRLAMWMCLWNQITSISLTNSISKKVLWIIHYIKRNKDAAYKKQCI